jgi:hypothetical protein
VLYRDVVIKTVATLHLLADATRASELINNPVGPHIIHLSITSSIGQISHKDKCYGISQQQSRGHVINIQCDMSSLTNDLLIVLMALTNLQSLSLQGHLTLGVIAMSARMSCSTLRRLTLEAGDSDAVQSLRYIHLLSSLDYLDLDITTLLRHDASAMAMFKAWKLPRLRTLRIKASAPWNEILARFLSSCQFSGLNSLYMSLPNTTLSSKAGKHLASLFLRLPELQEAVVYMPGHRYETILPFLQARCVEVDPLTADAMRYLSTSTNTVRVPLTTIGGSDSPAWPALDGLIATRQTAVRAVCITGRKFSWITEPDNAGDVPSGLKALPYLLKYSALLLRVGIDLKDGSGRTLMDYFSKKQSVRSDHLENA